jgi:6-phosphofructokinase 2
VRDGDAAPGWAAPILTITPSPTVDFTAEVPELVPHRKLRAHISAFQPGGGGVNVARVLHDLGVATTAVVAVGGLPGDIVLDRLHALGIHTVAVPTVAETRWAEMLRERSTGIEYRLIAEASPLDETEWRACVHAVEAAVADPHGAPGAIVLSGSVPPGVPDRFVHELAAVARRAGLPILVDTSGPALAAAVEAGVDLIKPSRGELAALSGTTPGELDHEAAARDLVARGVGAVVVSLGADGAFVATRDGHAHFHPPAAAVVSTVGAGDAMVAGILAGLTAGRPVVDATRLGVALGTATCCTPAGQPARPEDVDRLDAALAAGVQVP